MGIESEEDVQLLASYFLKHREAAPEDDSGNLTVRCVYLLNEFSLSLPHSVHHQLLSLVTALDDIIATVTTGLALATDK